MKQTLVVAAILLSLAGPAIADGAQADEAALAFLASLGDKPDDRVLGTVTLAMFDGPMPVGEWSYRLSTVPVDGRPCYRLDMTMRLEIEDGPRNEITAFAVVTPDLRTLESESRETQEYRDQRLSRVTKSARAGNRITVSRTVNGETKEWAVDARPGLIDSGAEPLLVMLLSRRGVKEGRMAFVDRQQNWFLPLVMLADGAGTTEVTAGRYETLGYRIVSNRFDAEAGVPMLDKAGEPVPDVRRYRLTTGGRPVLFEIADVRLRLEIRPESGAPGTPVGTVCAFLRAMAGKDRDALMALVDWDAAFEGWRKGPGATETRGKSDQELAVIRERFPADFVEKLVASATEGQARSLRLMANPIFWTATSGENGVVVVRMTEAKTRENPTLASFVFQLRQVAAEAFQITAFPGS